MDDTLLLEWLFYKLVREYRFQLGYREYFDMIKALQMGYGAGNRANLVWLCQTMWARSAEQQRIIQNVFDKIAKPNSAEIERLDKLLDDKLKGVEEQKEAEEDTSDTHTGNDTPLADRMTAGEGSTGISPAPDEEIKSPGVEITQDSDVGLALPRAEIPSQDTRDTEKFVFTPRPILPMRSLVITWRRYRQARRVGAKTELDIDATIERRCQLGLLDYPVMRAPHRNVARLVVLIDVNEAMRPWQRLNQTLIQSLNESGILHLQYYYFNRMPDQTIYRDEQCYEGVRLVDAIRGQPASGVLIFGEAGMTIQQDMSTFSKRLRRFVRATQRYNWWPIVWAIPIPSYRWKYNEQQTTVRILQRYSQIRVASMTEDGLIEAIDVLRGTRT